MMHWFIAVLMITAAEGVSAPQLTPQSAHSVLVVWGHVARLNSDADVTFQLQFRPTSHDTVIRYDQHYQLRTQFDIPQQSSAQHINHFNHRLRNSVHCRWHGGAVGRASDLRFTGRWFEFCLGTIAQWPWTSYLHLCASVTKQYNLVQVKERWRSEVGKVTVDLATHWPLCGLSTYWLKAHVREMSTCLYAQL